MTEPIAVRQVPLLIVDFDSTIRHGFEELGRFVHGPDDVVVFYDAAVGIGTWRAAGGRVVGVSNQGGIGLGYVEARMIHDAHDRTIRDIDEIVAAWPGPCGWEDPHGGHAIDFALYCPHAPTAACWCRKPAPGMVHRAVYELEHRYPDEVYPTSLALFVGDREEDAQCAAKLGVQFVDALAWRATAKAITPEWLAAIRENHGR